jgi:hypothetical protein
MYKVPTICLRAEYATRAVPLKICLHLGTNDDEDVMFENAWS